MKLYNDDCLNVLKTLPNNSVDMILCDLPYGTVNCKWDVIIPFMPLWFEYKRIVKDYSAIVLFAQQPFTSKLIMSNIDMYKYNWIWQKDNAANFLNKRYQPGKITEDICVFGKGATARSPYTNMIYNPQFEKGTPYYQKAGRIRESNAVIRTKVATTEIKNDGYRYPNNILHFQRDREKLHPTQKPVKLLEYLIKTYTNEGMVVLDNTMGSGSTGVACINTNRDFIGIEKDKEIYAVAEKRIKGAVEMAGGQYGFL